jgi:Cft2 family RNA processing exonuclease
VNIGVSDHGLTVVALSGELPVNIQVLPLGGASEIGGSCAVVTIDDLTVVVDYGMRPNARDQKYADLEAIAECGVPAALLITHAHLDHVGGLPLFHRRFPETPMLATAPTVRIATTTLADSAAIMDRDWEGDPEFSQADVDALARVVRTVELDTPTLVASSESITITATYVRAGHILGAAMVVLEIEHVPSARRERIIFSGDVSLFRQPTIAGTDVDRVRDTRPGLFVCEGTYGIEEHGDLALQEARFAARVAEVLRGGGRVLIPAFAVGRAQNVALILRDAMRHPERIARALGLATFEMPRVPIYLDGMCRTVADLYTLHRDYLAEPLRRAAEHGHVFYDLEGQVRPIRSAAQRQELLGTPDPVVVIASSGMLTGGPSVAFAQAWAPAPENAILLCGYQDEESPGRALTRLTTRSADGGPPVWTAGETTVTVRCVVEQYGLSGHSDVADLETLLAAAAPQRVALVHGTPLRLSRLRDRLERTLGTAGAGMDIEVAHIGEPLMVPLRATTLDPRDDARRASGSRSAVGGPLADVLTGREFHGRYGRLPVTPFLTAALRTGTVEPVGAEDVVRLETLAPSIAPVSAGAIAVARDQLAHDAGTFWTPVVAGTHHLYLPRLAAEREPGSALVRSVQDRQRTRHLPLQKRDRARRERELARLGDLGVTSGDIVLGVFAFDDRPWLTPALLQKPVGEGFEAILPTGLGHEVLFHQVVARIGPFPALSGVPQGAMGAAAHFVNALWASLETVQLQGRAAHDATDDELPALLAGVWGLVARGALSQDAGALASVLLTDAGGARQRTTIADLQARYPGEATASPARVAHLLHELAGAGILAWAEGGDGVLDVAVRVGAMIGGADRVRRGPPMPTLGVAFDRLVRSAVGQALQSVLAGQGLPEHAGDGATAARTLLPGRPT